METSITTLVEAFADIRDFRLDRKKEHALIDIIVIAVVSFMCGGAGWTDCELIGRAKETFFRRFLGLQNGIPSHDTFNRVFRFLNPHELDSCFAAWVAAAFGSNTTRYIAFDGKTMRHSYDAQTAHDALRKIGAWSVDHGLVLGQWDIPEESNEIPALRMALDVIDIAGCELTADAAHCQIETAQTTIDHGGDYTFTVKKNQDHLHDDIEATFEALKPILIPYETVEKAHGRIEIRHYWTTTDLNRLRTRDKWAHLRSIGMVESERHINGKVQHDVRYYIRSRVTDTETFSRTVRRHWSIENNLHWVLDMTMDEDRSRIRKDHGAKNAAVLRRIALNLVKQDTTTKMSVRARRLYAAWNESYIEKILHIAANTKE